jgi:hypothetical protein
VTGTGDANYIPKFTGRTTIANSQIFDNGTRVGIGTFTPTLGKLQVEGDGIVINTENSNVAKFIYFRFSDGGDLRSDSFLTFSTGGMPTVKALITSTGNFGINTLTPQRRIDVVSSISNVPSAAFGRSIAFGEWAGLEFGYLEEGNSSYRKSALVFERVDASARGTIHILNNNDADISSASLANSRLSITSAGVVTLSNLAGTGTRMVVTNESGALSTQAITLGTVTSVAALTLGTTGTDLSSTVANGTTTPVITLNVPTASAANRGALSAADWTTFNGKQDNIVAGTTAQYYRGDKTFQTLNTSVVPELTNLYYTEARVSANTDVAANTAARHNAVTLGTANGLSLSTQELSLGLASSSANGALSSTDWTTFNNKQNALTNPVTGTGTTNTIPKFTGTSTIGNSQIIDDGTSVSIGGISENGFLNIAGLNQNLNIYCVTSVGPNWSANLFLKGGSLTSVQALYLGYGSNYYDVYIKRNVDGRLSLGTNQNDRLSIFNQGNVFIGSSVGISDNGTKLQVSGSASFTDLAGTGTRMVVANASGVLSTQAITVGTVTNVTASTPLFSSGGATPNITIQQASGSQNGFLSSTDWTTFNNKQNTITNPVTGTGTAGQVAYWSSGSAITGESNLFWDATNDRLGIGTATPAATLEINGDIRTGAPTGTSTINWKLGRALLATSSDPEDRWIRVQLGTKIYDILAIDRGDA